MEQKKMSYNTIDNYIRDIHQFKSFLKKDLITVSQSDIDNFIRHLNSLNLTPASVNRKLASIKKFYAFLMREHLISSNPTALVEGCKLIKKLPRVPDTDDLISVINRIDNNRDKLLLNILYCTGLRRFEVVKLQVSDINFNKGYIIVMGKGNKERVVPIAPSTLDDINKYIKEEGITKWLFPSTKNLGKCMSTRRLGEIVQECCNRVGVKGVSAHRFRAHFATTLYRKGADIKAIQSMLGHASINTTNMYTRDDLDRNISEYEKAFK